MTAPDSTTDDAAPEASSQRPRDLRERLETTVIRGDGSMGYLLVRDGVSRTQSFEFLNLEDPDRIVAVHKAYLDAAQVDLIQTNTFGANRFHLTTFGRSHERLVKIINEAGVDLAQRAAAGTDALVGGSIGPLIHSTGDRVPGRLDDAGAIAAAYEEQIEALGGAGVDAFVIETVHRRIEGITALRLARERFPEIPVVFQVASTERGETVAGDDLETIIREADELGADCLGLNCFLDAAHMYDLVLELQQWTDKPLAAQPNLGKRAQLCQGVFEAERSLHSTTRSFTARLVSAGVRLIGGCCGITPEHIALVQQYLRKVEPIALETFRRKHLERYERAREITVGTYRKRPDYIPTRLESDLRSGDPDRRPVLVEVDPPRIGESPEKYIRDAQRLAEAGVQYITIADNPGRVPRMDRDAFARKLLEACPELELVLHVSCADMTLVRFATLMESLHTVSRNILVISGDPPSGDFVRSSAPYDFRSVSAIRALSRRNHGFGLTGQEDLAATDYFVGGALNPRGLEPQMRKFWTKSADAGASFCLTQPLFEASDLEALAQQAQSFRERLEAERGRECFFFPGVMSLASSRNANILRQSFGMPISRRLVEELAGLPTKKAQRRRGREIQREMMAGIRANAAFQGIYVVTQFHNSKAVISDLRETGWLPAEAGEA